ncbi:response regulator transcription factor, partial [Plantactinospora endophytica]|uniref:response regulator transcription factor n=1 Tax=Plantactinospora endophytica TaxID=673535 RepID=UPI003638F71A
AGDAGSQPAGQRLGSVLRAPTGPGRDGPTGDGPGTGRPPGDEPAVRRRDDPEPRAGTGEPGSDQPAGPAVVPAQRGDDPNAPGEPAQTGTGAGGTGTQPPYPGEKAASDVAGTEPGAGDPGRPAPARRPVLTEREMQVLVGMADGKSNAEIGRELFVSEDTVKTHARRLFRKLGARDRAHAVAAGFRAGLVA